MRCDVVAIGTELLLGQITDTNSQWIGEQLAAVGIDSLLQVKVGDNHARIVTLLGRVLADADAVIVCGGLGPTHDDLTREAIAAVSNRSLVQVPEVVVRMEQFFRERRREMSETNLKQALLPSGATIIENHRGTAPGFWLECARADRSQAVVCAMPGVPAELRPMFDTAVLPIIRQRLGVNAQQERRIMRVFALPEAEVGARIERLKLAPEIEVSYRALFPEIQVILKSRGELKILNHAADAVEDALGVANVFSKSLDCGMEQAAHDELLRQGSTVAVAESCTGGLVGSLLSKTPGASNYFLGGVISYSNEIKISQLGVKREILDQHGAVSAEVVKAMASGVRARFGSSVALSVSGVAGPDGGSDSKPVGRFFIGFATADQVQAFQYFFPTSRERIQTFAAYCAIDLLRRYLLGLSLRNETPQ